MANVQLTDPKFWIAVEAEEILPEIARLAAIPEPTRGERNQLRKLRIKLVTIESEAEKLAALNAKWQAGEVGHTKLDGLVPLEGDIFPTEEPKQNKLTCSFCGIEVSHITSTRGTAEPKVHVKLEEREVAGELVTIEKKVVQAAKVVACRNCEKNVKKPVVVSRV